MQSKTRDLPDHAAPVAHPYPAADPAAARAWEARRLVALHESGILDTGSEQSFDDITALAAQICETPLALVSFVDEGRVWFKSCFGGDFHEYSRANSFCNEAIRSAGVFEVPDLAADQRFANHVLVRESGFRFYAASQVRSANGANLGTLSVVDYRPRSLTVAQRSALTRLANQSAGQIALKSSLRDQEREIAKRTSALRVTEARLLAFMQHAPLTLSVKDLTGQYLMVNRACAHFYDKSPEEMLGLCIDDVDKSSGAVKLKALEADMLATGTPVTREIAYPHKDGMRWYRDIKFPIPDDNGATVAIGGIGLEITQGRVAQEELIDAKEHAEAANQAKSQFLANMSHELRTPLNAILGFSEILASNALGPLGPERAQAYAEDIHQSGRLLLNIINDILDLSKIEAGRMELREAPCDLGGLTKNALNLIANAAQAKSLKLINSVPTGLPRVRADERALTQILLNLVNNAVKFTLPGGEIRVDAARVNGGDAGDGLALAVSDTGIGIASEDIPLVFSAFGQVQGAFVRGHEGAGLGLPIARALAEAQGGKLDLQSRIGIGTRVTLWFPSIRVIDG